MATTSPLSSRGIAQHTRYTVRAALQSKVNFDCGNMHARTDVHPAQAPCGQLPADERELFLAAIAPHALVVWSYLTPIAWITADGQVVIPETRHSVTTSRHQGLCRAWL